MIKSGDQVRYKSDAYPEYTGKLVKVIDFNLEHRFCGVEAPDGTYFTAFWDDISVPQRNKEMDPAAATAKVREQKINLHL